MKNKICMKKALIEAGKRMVREKLTVGTWGNISIRDEETDHFFITPSGMVYNELKIEDIVEMDLDGNMIDSIRKPSIEWRVHLGIYKKRPEINAVLHTHAVYPSVFSVIRESIPAAMEDIVQLIGGDVEVAEYALPGTKELAVNTLKALKHKYAVLFANHGELSIGETLDKAFLIAQILERSSHILVYAKLMGNIHEISKKDQEAMKEFVKTKYGQH